MDINARQFGKYQFFGYRDPHGNVSISAFTNDDHTPVHAGAMAIDSDRRFHADMQRKINDPSNGASHRVFEDEDGQRRFGLGNLEPSYPKVSWLGTLSSHRNPTLLSGMMGLARHLHGSAPLHADDTLSTEGASVSQHMAKKGMITPHPDNPTMVANWFPLGDRDEERYVTEIDSLTGRDMDDDYEDPDEWDEDYDDIRAMTDEEWTLANDKITGFQNARSGVAALDATGSRWPGAWMPEDGAPSVASTVRALRTLHPAKRVQQERIDQRRAYFEAREDPTIHFADRPRYQETQKETLF